MTPCSSGAVCASTLARCSVELGLAVVELLLDRVELVADGGEGAVLAGLRPLLGQGLTTGVDLRLAAVELGEALLELTLALGHLLGRIVEPVLGGERIGHVRDVVDLRDLVEQVDQLATLLRGEGRPVGGLGDDRAVAAAGRPRSRAPAVARRAWWGCRAA